jgi:flagellar basal body rod protein FlgC
MLDDNEFVEDYYYPNNASCDNNGYIVCGNCHMITEYTQCINVLKGIVYLKDIIAILGNRLLACSKVKIVDNRIYYPTYEVYTPIDSAEGEKLFIKE